MSRPRLALLMKAWRRVAQSEILLRVHLALSAASALDCREATSDQDAGAGTASSFVASGLASVFDSVHA